MNLPHLHLSITNRNTAARQIEVKKTKIASNNEPFSGSGAQKQTVEKIHSVCVCVCVKSIPHSLPSLSEAFTGAAHHINIALY